MGFNRSVAAQGGASQRALTAVVVRCRCGDPDRLHPCTKCGWLPAEHEDPRPHSGAGCCSGYERGVCPKGVEERLGTVAFWHKDWRVRAIHWLLTKTGHRFELWVGDKE